MSSLASSLAHAFLNPRSQVKGGYGNDVLPTRVKSLRLLAGEPPVRRVRSPQDTLGSDVSQPASKRMSRRVATETRREDFFLFGRAMHGERKLTAVNHREDKIPRARRRPNEARATADSSSTQQQQQGPTPSQRATASIPDR
uniref:Uncharacterized protein n=1 Tax=Anopheles albimanus TaxID=7167 RepID=A0A182FHE8_ANOAL